MSPAQTRDFEQFWLAYPRRIGKLAAMREWARRAPDLETVLTALDWQRRSWTDVRFIPHPRTWLSQGRWMDEPEPTSVPKTRLAWVEECAAEDHKPRCPHEEYHDYRMGR